MSDLTNAQDQTYLAQIWDDLDCGIIDPVEAERRALAAGLPPLNPAPDPSGFDPMELSGWTITMTVAWIVWRTADEVRAQWADFRSLRRKWMRTSAGWTLEQSAGPSNLYRMGIDFSLRIGAGQRPENFPTLESAVAELVKLLSLGRLSATAISVRTGGVVEIPKIEWGYIEVPVWSESNVRLNGGHRAEYHDLRFDREGVLRTWPPYGDISEIDNEEHGPLEQNALTSAATRRPGRKPGSGAYDDSLHLVKMKELLDLKHAKSVWEAAGSVSAGAKGASAEAIQKRLSDKFRGSYPEFA